MKNWRLWVGILVSLVCLYLVARGVDLHRLLQALSHVRYTWLVPAFGIVVLGMLARAFRWRLLLYPLSGLSVSRLFNVLSIGYLVNNVSPFRLGDVLRAFLCAELEKTSIVRALSTVMIERIADMLAILTLLLVTLPFVSLPGVLVRPALGIGLLAITAVLVLVLIAWQKERSLALFGRLAARVHLLNRDWLRRGVASAVDGLSGLSSWRAALGVWVWSLAAWLGGAVQLYVLMQATGLRLPLSAALLVLCLTSLGMAVPSSPAYIGVFEYLTVLSLSLFGVAREAALGYALVAHAVGYVALSLLGLRGAWAEGYSYVRLRRLLSPAAPDATST